MRSATSPPPPRQAAGTACSSGSRYGASTHGSRWRWPRRAPRSIRLGTMLTPPSRRRPWELASQVATVDRLSEGRVTLSVGLGAVDSGFAKFGEETDRRIRAELLDECLDIVTGLWAGQPFSFEGKHYTVQPTEFPTIGETVQQPRVPIWCVGMLGRPKSMARALRWDGLLPQAAGGQHPTLAQISAIREGLGDREYDIVIEGEGNEHSPAAWASAGATWWIESMWSAVNEIDAALAANDRLIRGPREGRATCVYVEPDDHNGALLPCPWVRAAPVRWAGSGSGRPSCLWHSWRHQRRQRDQRVQRHRPERDPGRSTRYHRPHPLLRSNNGLDDATTGPVRPYWRALTPGLAECPPMPGGGLRRVWEAVADRLPDAPAQRHAGASWTWRVFDRRADAVAAHLLASGLAEQDKVAQYLYNGPEYLESVFAAFKAGLAVVNTNYRYTDRRADLPVGQRRRRRRRLPRRLRRAVRRRSASGCRRSTRGSGSTTDPGPAPPGRPRTKRSRHPGRGERTRRGDARAITCCSSTPGARRARRRV